MKLRFNWCYFDRDKNRNYLPLIKWKKGTLKIGLLSAPLIGNKSVPKSHIFSNPCQNILLKIGTF